MVSQVKKSVPNQIPIIGQAAIMLWLVLSLCSCKAAPQGSDVFWLCEETVAGALEEAGLPGMISEEETVVHSQGDLTYVVRDPSQTYSGTDNPAFVAGVRGTSYEGKRMLLATFDQEVDSEQIDWEDWRNRLAFAAQLYGGLENAEEIYTAFAAKEVPSGQDALM